MDYPSRIRIVCDTGLVKDVRVFDAETGRELTPNAPITAIDLTIQADDPGGQIKAIVYWELPVLDLTARAEWEETLDIHVDGNDRGSIVAAIARLQSFLEGLESQHAIV